MTAIELGEFVTAAEVAVINDCRVALRAIHERCMSMAYDEGGQARAGAIVAAKADTAKGSLFDVLNVLSSYAHVELTKEMLHGAETESAA